MHSQDAEYNIQKIQNYYFINANQYYMKPTTNKNIIILTNKLNTQHQQKHQQIIYQNRLLLKLQIQDYYKIQNQIKILENQIDKQKQIKNKLEQANLSLQQTGKKIFPRIIVKPEFIATENVSSIIKEFYFKVSKTFLREEILRRKQNQADTVLLEKIKSIYKQLKDKQTKIKQQNKVNYIQISKKRMRNVKLQSKLILLKNTITIIKFTNNQQQTKYNTLLNEFQQQKLQIDKKQIQIKQLSIKLSNQKNKIFQIYNPKSYRNYLKQFYFQSTKNQIIMNNFQKVSQKVREINQNNQKIINILKKKYNCFNNEKLDNKPSVNQKYDYSPALSSRAVSTPKQSNFGISLSSSKILRSELFSQTLKRDKLNSGSTRKTAISSTSNLLRNSSLSRNSTPRLQIKSKES